MFKKLLRTMGRYKGQFISMIIMITIGVGVFLGFNMEWYTLDRDTDKFYKETGLSDYQIISADGFSDENLEDIKSLSGIEDATRYVKMRTEVKDNSENIILVSVAENIKVSGFKLIKGAKYDKNSEDGIWLSDKYAEKNNVKLGDEISVLYNNAEIKGEVKGLVKSGEYAVCLADSSQILPDFEKNGFMYISPALYKKTFGMEYYPQINVKSELEKKELSEKIDTVLTNTPEITSKDENVSYAGPQGEITEGKTMALAIPVLFLLIAVLTMVTTMHRLAAKEKIQIGTFKALGLKDSKILIHYASYSLFIGVVGSVLGAGLGYAIAKFILDPKGGMMAVYIDMPYWDLKMPTFSYFVIIGLILGLTLIGYLSTRMMLKGNAADALRPYSPKKVKPLLIEKTKFFHKLSFGTRWNLRDTARHKSRTIMSIIGTMGCTMILICCFGLSDTVYKFQERYYDGAINYKSRIFVTNGDEYVDKFDGDASASISVQLDGDAVMLDVYRLGKNKMRFLDDKMNLTKLNGNGAYVCKRIADDYDLDVGDKFTLKPFGTDDKYDLKVEGIISSFAKGIAITEDYAKEIKIPYKIDSIYTDTEKSDIKIGDGISSVQTKKSLIDAFEVMVEIMDLMVVMLVVAAMILGVVVLYNLGIMSYTERYRELSTLKVVGFKDSKISRLLVGQNFSVTVFGIIIGIPLGLAALKLLADKLAPEYELTVFVSALSYSLSILITFGVSLFVSLMLARKNKKIDMVESLKNAD